MLKRFKEKYKDIPWKSKALYFTYEALSYLFLVLIVGCMGCVFGLALYLNNCKKIEVVNIAWFSAGFVACALLAMLITWIQIYIKPWYNSVYSKIFTDYVEQRKHS